MTQLLRRFDVRVTLIYGVIAALWIILSDTLVSFLFGAESTLSTAVSIFKGLGFVVITTLGLFLVLSAELQRRRRIENDLKKMTRLYRLLSDGNQTLIRAIDEKQLLQSLCTLIVEGGGYKLAWVGYAEADIQKSIKVMASAGYEDGYLEQIHLTWDDAESGQGPTGRAIRTSQPTVSRFIQTDPHFGLWRKEAIARGYASSIALPIVLNRQVIGTLNIYSAHEDAFDTAETNLLVELTYDLAYGINAIRTTSDNERTLKMLEQEREISPVGIVIVNSNRVISYVNAQAQRILQLTRGTHPDQIWDVSYLRITDFEGNPFPEDQQPSVQAIRAKQAVYGIQQVIEWPDGRRVMLEMNAAPVFDANGDIREVVTTFDDVTVRIHAEKALLDSIDSSRLLFLSNPHPMWVFDVETYAFLEVNNAAVALYGYSRDEFLSMKVMDIRLPEDVPELLKLLNEPLPDFKQFDEVRHQRKNGQVIDVELTTHRIEYAGRNAILVVSQDVTKRKLAEKALLESEASLKRAQTIAHLGDWTWDTETNTVRWSDEMYRIFGIDREIFDGDLSKIIDAAIHPDDRAAVLQRNNDVVFGQKPGVMEYRVVWADGTVRHVLAVPGEQMTDTDGKIKQLSGIVQDITERKLAEKALLESEASLKRAQAVAHVGDWTWDLTTNSIDASDELYSIFGIDRASFSSNLAEVLENYTHPDDKAIVLEAFRNVVDSKTFISMEYRIIRPDGGVRHIWAEVGESLMDANGDIVQLTGILQDVTVLKAAEEELRLKSTALESAANGIVITDTNGIIEWANPAFTTLTGYTFDEAKGLNPRELINSGEHTQDFFEAMWATILAGQVWHGELVNRRKDGSTYIEEQTITPIRNPIGEITHFTGIKQDITKRKQAEEELRLKSAALESAANGIVITDTHGIIEWINPAFTTLTGYTSDEAKGRNQRDLINSGQHDKAFYIDLWTTILDGNVWHGELINRRKDGTIYIEEQTITPVRSTSGEITHFIGIKQDVSQRIQDEEAVRNLNTELEGRVAERTTQLTHIKTRIESILNSNADPIIYSRIDGKIEQVNPAFTQIFGYESDEILRQPVHKLVPEEQVSDLDAAFAEVVANRHVHHVEVSAYNKNGEPLDVSVRLSPVIENHDRLIGVVLSVHDISEHHRLLRHAMELNEVKSRYVSMAAHDLRNPMAVILTSSDTIEYYYERLSEEKRKSKFEQIRSSIRVMTDILDDVLLLGQAESGKLGFHPEPMDVVAFCKMLVEEFLQATDSAVFIDFSTEGLINPVAMDAKLLRHILSNLLSNALKYSVNSSTVHFNVKGADSQIVFRIKDFGIGIPKDDQARLFETFHRASNARHLRGTGLGLAIVKQSVDVHGGSITFESEEGVGTTFTVSLPSGVKATEKDD